MGAMGWLNDEVINIYMALLQVGSVTCGMLFVRSCCCSGRLSRVSLYRQPPLDLHSGLCQGTQLLTTKPWHALRCDVHQPSCNAK